MPHPNYLLRDRIFRLGDEPESEKIFKASGEFRYPRIDEYFLSGAVVEVYQARHNFTFDKYHIAVEVEK